MRIHFSTLTVKRSTAFAYSLLSLLMFNFAWCQNTSYCKPKDCIDLKCYRVSTGQDGPHTVYPGIDNLTTLTVSCDQTAPGGGWTVWLRRSAVANDISFNRTWDEYKTGFGRHGGPHTELYLGNENVHLLTQNEQTEILLEGFTYNGGNCSVGADYVKLAPELDQYSVTFGRLTRVVNASEGIFEFHENAHFSANSDQCPAYGDSMWWYAQCTMFFMVGTHTDGNDAVHTHIYISNCSEGYDVPLKRANMLLRAFSNESRQCDNPCLHGATCEYIAPNDTHRCLCPESHCGARCETANMCRNNGTCLYDATEDAFSCECVAGYFGPRCRVSVKIFAIVVIVSVVSLAVLVAGLRSRSMRRKEEEEERRLDEADEQLSQSSVFRLYGMR